MNPHSVNSFLHNVDKDNEIKVTFLTGKGETRTYIGKLIEGPISESVAIYTFEGWKRFNVNNVINIEELKG